MYKEVAAPRHTPLRMPRRADSHYTESGLLMAMISLKNLASQSMDLSMLIHALLLISMLGLIIIQVLLFKSIS